MSLVFDERYIRAQLFNRIRHFPGQSVTYIENPKVACTSIELMLWRSHDPDNVPQNPHRQDLPNRPFPLRFVEADGTYVSEVLASEFFTMVRNPYARFLSAYLNKVQMSEPWRKLSPEFGFPDSDVVPTMLEFLEVITAMDPLELDHHFRPQHITLLNGFLPVDRLDHMERMGRFLAYLRKRNFDLAKDAPSPTNAQKRVRKLIGEKEARMIARFYEKDFEIYGYETDIERQMPANPPKLSTDRTALKTFLAPKLKGRLTRIPARTA